MKFNLLNRKIHYWLSIGVAIPALIVICSGLLLQVKKQFTWVQPSEQKGKSKTAKLSMPQILEISKTIPEAEIKDWDDINRLDVRPSRGMLKVFAKNHWEIQIDAETGEILQTAYRRSDIIESIHDGSFFHDYVKLWIFLPSGIILLILWLTGIYLFILPIWVKRKRKIARE
ncbi:MAG: PepSY domain-containing protein [Pyrinomonadaceae bacterium]|nr:PepSY domain-containing protein [Pyrinomonadaceae bacterium]